jgi:hypothetical protein
LFSSHIALHCAQANLRRAFNQDADEMAQFTRLCPLAAHVNAPLKQWIRDVLFLSDRTLGLLRVKGGCPALFGERLLADMNRK